MPTDPLPSPFSDGEVLPAAAVNQIITAVADNQTAVAALGTPGTTLTLSGTPQTTLAIGTGLSVSAGTLTAPGGGAGVSTFNSRNGAVTLLRSDVIAALTFTPGVDTGWAVVDSTMGDAAINVVIAAGANIFFKAGTYNTAGLSGPNSGQYFRGAGKGLTILQHTGTTGAVFTVANGVSNAGIASMTITRASGVTAVSGAYGIATAATGTLDTVEGIALLDLAVTRHWVGLHLGPTNYSIVRDVEVARCLSDGVFLTNTAGTSGAWSNPLQWTFDHVLSEFNAGRGFALIGTAMTRSGGSIALGEWKNISTFANTGAGIVVVGNGSCSVCGVRVSSGSFIGGDGNTEIYLDSYGQGHDIAAEIELAGQGPTGPSYATAASGVGQGIVVTANNSGVNIHDCRINGCSADGVYTAANLYGALTAATVVSGCQITNNGLAGTSGAQSGINIAGGPAVVAGNFIGQWNTAAGTGPQKYGVSIAADLATVVGNDLTGNATSAIYAGVTLTNSIVDRNRGYSSGGGGVAGVSSFNSRSGVVSLTSGDVTGALGFTPISSAPVSSFNARTGAISLTSGDVTGALGFTPASSTSSGVSSFNARSGAVTLTSGDVTSALGGTPVQSVAGVSGATVSAAALVSPLAAAGLVAASQLGATIGLIGHLDVPTAGSTALRVCWGYGTTDSSGSCAVTWDAAFANGLLSAVVGLRAGAPAGISVGLQSVGKVGAWVYAANGSGTGVIAGFNYIAVGY